MRSNRWELEEAQKCLYADPPDVQLARRYLEKALEAVRCMYCHNAEGPLDAEHEFRAHFKGYVHLDCDARYAGRIDYEMRHNGS